VALSLYTLGVRLADRLTAGQDATDELIDDIVDAALRSGELTLPDILAELHDPHPDRGGRYRNLIVQVGGRDGLKVPLWELADTVRPIDRALICTLARAAVSLAAQIELGEREAKHVNDPHHWWAWMARHLPFGA
jgi:hypothetical protein